MSLFTAGTYAQDATTQTAPNPNGPKMAFDVMEHNFGTIKQGEVATYEFKFKNTGKEPLVISNAVGSCGCTVPEWPKEPIAPGKTGVIKVTFNSAGKQGQIDKTVTLTSNSVDGQVQLHMKGEVVLAQAETPATTTTTPATTTGKDPKQKEPAQAPAMTQKSGKANEKLAPAEKPKN